jgi:hypothetical protein
VTIEELRALVQSARDSTQIAWDGVVLAEETSGRLKQLNDSADATIRLYNLALEQLAKQFPSTEDARLILSGAQGLERGRGGEQPATDALVSLTVYSEAPYYGTSIGASYAAAVKV